MAQHDFVRSDLLTAIFRRLNDAGIEIPFPQRDLHLKDIDLLEALLAGRAQSRDASLPMARTRRPDGPGAAGWNQRRTELAFGDQIRIVSPQFLQRCSSVFPGSPAANAMRKLIPRGRWLLLEFIFYKSSCLAFLFMVLQEWWIMGLAIVICVVVAAVNLRADRKTRPEEADRAES